MHQCPVERLGLDENFIDVSSIVKARKKSGDDFKNVSGNVFGEKRGDCHCECDCRTNMTVGSILAEDIRKQILDRFPRLKSLLALMNANGSRLGPILSGKQSIDDLIVKQEGNEF